MKVIFLDIDGVMNHRQYFKRSRLHDLQEFCPIAVRNLREIIKRTNSFIVVSSTWRKGHSLFSLKRLFAWYDLDKYVIGKTPVLDNQIRGNEIKQFIETFNDYHWKKPITQFVILDDDKDMGEYMDRLVRTDWKYGLSEDDKREQAIEMLNQN